jgi:hypothetical protein
MINRVFLILVAGAMGMSLARAEEPRVTFPRDYTETFTNYLSLDRVQNPDQIIRLFANELAIGAGSRGAELPEGSILVGEVYSARKDAEGNIAVSSLGRRIRDKLVAIAVMEKRAGWGAAFPENLRNGDWDFAIFSPDGKPLNKDLNACRACHAPLKESQHIFSLQHLVK